MVSLFSTRSESRSGNKNDAAGILDDDESNTWTSNCEEDEQNNSNSSVDEFYDNDDCSSSEEEGVEQRHYSSKKTPTFDIPTMSTMHLFNRRKGRLPLPDHNFQNVYDNDPRDKKGKSSKLWRIRYMKSVDHLARRVDGFCSLELIHRVSQRLFWVGFLTWALSHALQLRTLRKLHSHESDLAFVSSQTAHERVQIISHVKLVERMKEKHAVDFWTGLANWIRGMASPSNQITENANQRAKKKEVDSLDCVRDYWQSLSFPTCNEIHEVDLESILFQMNSQSETNPQANPYRRTLQQTSAIQRPTQLGYLGSGLWRTVWIVNPHLANELVVLKTMKNEHEVDRRNMERHRRDALVMERLTSSPNIVNIHGYCGNSILSEFIPLTLTDLIQNDLERRRQQAQHNNTQSENVAHGSLSVSSPMTESNQKQTRNTEAGRLNLSVAIVKGLYDIHNRFPTGPIVHADLTSEQFLVTASGQVKMNDFNRCRFMAHRKSNASELCPFIIPSSPGKNRSPEEYGDKELTEKLDVYAIANILFFILTGDPPWFKVGEFETQHLVEQGERPQIPFPINPNSSDALLASLIERAYEVNPERRITAKDLLQELEQAQQSI